MNELVDGFKKGFAQGWRGYFAPLRLCCPGLLPSGQQDHQEQPG